MPCDIPGVFQRKIFESVVDMFQLLPRLVKRRAGRGFVGKIIADVQVLPRLLRGSPDLGAGHVE